MTVTLDYPVRSPQWILTYTGVNISSDVSQMVLEITYTDHLSGAAGEVEVKLEDHDKLWQGPWFPTHGDLINLMIGYEGELLLPCGNFQVDDLELSGPPDVFHLRCIAAYITPMMRTRNSVGYENQTLLQIAATIANKYRLTLVSTANSINVRFARVTQKQETDLGFLHRIAREHNYDFTIRGSQLIFYACSGLEQADPAAIIKRFEVLAFAFKSKTHEIYRSAQVAYQDFMSKMLITQTQSAVPPVATGDTLKLTPRCENGQQAMLRVESALHEANKIQVTASLVTPGFSQLVAGNVVALSGFGAYDGNYLIRTARHLLTRDTGYTTAIEARQTQAAGASA